MEDTLNTLMLQVEAAWLHDRIRAVSFEARHRLVAAAMELRREGVAMGLDSGLISAAHRLEGLAYAEEFSC